MRIQYHASPLLESYPRSKIAARFLPIINAPRNTFPKEISTRKICDLHVRFGQKAPA